MKSSALLYGAERLHYGIPRTLSPGGGSPVAKQHTDRRGDNRGDHRGDHMVANPLYPDAYKTACIRALHGALEKSTDTGGKRSLRGRKIKHGMHHHLW